MKTCPGCGSDMKVVPAGVSKSTGKPYESFETCSARCGFKVTQKPGYTTIVRESSKPSQVPHPTNGDDRDRMMLISYRKDLMCTLIEVYGETNEPSDIKVRFQEYWTEIVAQPLGRV